MTAVSFANTYLSPEDFLDGEAESMQRHEYMNGTVHAMAGGTQLHNRICMRLAASLERQLRGKRCTPWNSDMLLHIKRGFDERFYYPDVSVTCGPTDLEARYIENPTVVFEVLSESTQRIDLGEKKDAYLGCESLQAYVVVHADVRGVIVHSRTADGWQITHFQEPGSVIQFPSIECALSLAEIYGE